MGFKQDGYMTVWGVEPGKSANITKVRLSSRRKNKKTEQYEQDFSGICTFIGDAHQAATKLKEKDRIKITSCEVSNSYNKEKGTTFVDYKVFSFEMADGSGESQGATASPKKPAYDEGETEYTPF